MSNKLLGVIAAVLLLLFLALPRLVMVGLGVVLGSLVPTAHILAK